MTTYKKIDDVTAYIKELTASGVEVLTAEKVTRIAARKGVVGEQVISWSVDANGAPILEKNAQVVEDSETGEAGWVVTKLDEDNQIIIDPNGNKNEWIIDDKTFHKKYEEDPNHPGIYKPVGGPQKFMKLSEAITIQQWGNEVTVDAGGYMNMTNPDDIYVIAGRDFEDTYRVI